MNGYLGPVSKYKKANKKMCLTVIRINVSVMLSPLTGGGLGNRHRLFCLCSYVRKCYYLYCGGRPC